jgi:hypothetical protein
VLWGQSQKFCLQEAFKLAQGIRMSVSEGNNKNTVKELKRRKGRER